MFGPRVLARGLVVVSTAWIVGSGALAARENVRGGGGPAAVSPGGAERASSAARCATFSWGGVGGAEAYELAVYRLDSGGGVESEPLFTQRIVGSALSWTPEPERCPVRGERYAWTVRAATAKGPTAWSEPLFFDVEKLPSAEELAWALEIVRSRAAGNEPVTAAEASRQRDIRADATVASRSPRQIEPRESGVLRRASSALDAGRATAALRVAGEVRTVDPTDAEGLSRLWGTGRVEADTVFGQSTVFGELPCFRDGVLSGLSATMVDWGSAPAACPAGTWVCKGSEVAECDTVRPDTGSETIACDGSSADTESDDHIGWLAGRAVEFSRGVTFSEGGSTGHSSTCRLWPVWCCWN